MNNTQVQPPSSAAPEGTNFWMKALYDFDPQCPGDLRLSAGDLIRITGVPPGKTLPVSWLVGEVNGRNGMFPTNYCGLIAEAPGPENDGQTSRTYYFRK